MRATATTNQIRAFRLLPGDTVLTKDSETADDIGVSAFITESARDFVCGYHLAIVRPDPAVLDPKFLFWVTRSAPFRSQLAVAATGVTRFGLRTEALLNASLAVPPLDEQRRIAGFLDLEVGAIDAAMGLCDRQLRLADERVQAVIFGGVTGADVIGPRRTVSPWVGSIPQSWTWEPVSARYLVQLGKMLNAERTQGDHLKPYLRNTNVQWDRIDTHDLKLMDFPPQDRVRYKLRPGDLMVCEGGISGRAAMWEGAVTEMYYQKALHRVRPRAASQARWLFYCLHAAVHRGVFANEGGATTISHLPAEDLRAARFPFPGTAEEERAVVERLDAELDRTRAMRRLVEQQRRLLQERKQSLVTAAVTGDLALTATGSAL